MSFRVVCVDGPIYLSLLVIFLISIFNVFLACWHLKKSSFTVKCIPDMPNHAGFDSFWWNSARSWWYNSFTWKFGNRSPSWEGLEPYCLSHIFKLSNTLFLCTLNVLTPVVSIWVWDIRILHVDFMFHHVHLRFTIPMRIFLYSDYYQSSE